MSDNGGCLVGLAGFGWCNQTNLIWNGRSIRTQEILGIIFPSDCWQLLTFSLAEASHTTKSRLKEQGRDLPSWWEDFKVI